MDIFISYMFYVHEKIDSYLAFTRTQLHFQAFMHNVPADVPRQIALNMSLTRFTQTTYIQFSGRKCAH